LAFERLKSLARLRPYLVKHRRELVIGFIFTVFSNTIFAIMPKVLQFAIDKIKEGVPASQLFRYGLLLIGMTAVYATTRFILRRIIFSAGRKIEYELRNDFFQHLQSLSLLFFVKNRTGDLMSRAVNDIRQIAMTLGRIFVFLFSNFIVFTISIYLMLSTSVSLTLLVLIPFPLVLVVVYKTIDFFFHIYEKIQAEFADITTLAQENISGVRVVKAYLLENQQLDKFHELNRIYLKENLRRAKGQGFLSASMEVLFSFSLVLLLGFGGMAVIHDKISIGAFVAFTVWVNMLAWPIISFGWIYNLIQRAAASMARINKIWEQKPEIQDTDCKDDSIKNINGNIEFQNISFAYNGEPVLKNISFSVEAGKTLAIVGPTGSGKTTLVNLISRLIDPDSGKIFIDGHDIQCIPLKILRKNIGYVPQETFLFSDTIRENIAFGNDEVSDEEIEWAATISTIKDDLMKFPEKYETLIGERGVNLSGGQKQRTAISRALLRKPKILILDDALSSVDTYTEEKILRALKENHFQQINIVISHRISSIKHADLILVLKKGEIVERGTHEELLRQKAFYAKLYEQQLLEQALEEI